MASHSKHQRRRKAPPAKVTALDRLWFNAYAAVWLTARMGRFAYAEMRRSRRA